MKETKFHYKNKWVYIALAIFLGTVGVQKIYARRGFAFTMWIFLMFFLIGFDLEGLIPLIVTIDIVATAFQSEEKFLIKCNRKFFSGYSKEERSEMISHLVKNGTINGDQVIKVNQIVPDQIAIKVPGEEIGEAESHNHIKEDKQLSAFVNQSQDKLDRFQNNNYFPSVDSSKLYDKKLRSERIKELRQEYKDGLMSKEDYEEALRNL